MATQSAAQRAKDAAAQAAKLANPSVPTQQIVPANALVMTYQITADVITGQGKTGAVDSPGHLSGIVTQADIIAFGADFEWLLRSEAIVEAGYAPIR